MSILKYKIRGNLLPQGKSKVYFTCHCEDFIKYFDLVADELLIRQNIVVWYRDPKVIEFNEEEHLLNLSHMQLFVIPVTNQLLLTKNYALDVEFKYAIKHHIPVLPIMQESGLEDLFNYRCGNLQYLDKTNNDQSAISYDDKLTKYLENLIVGDELAKKVRDAFNAYIFLSYRKKDRKYAQELMKLIHQNEICQDVAIWYDEFLTPGEDFNDEILQIIEKSSLFALVVTPNIINEINYIMTIEYPKAKEINKKILPIEFLPTNHQTLKDKYLDLPNIIDVNNTKELASEIVSVFGNITTTKKDDNPNHNYLIGLAYLKGIDVEVNRELAVKLITKSANEGLIEAIEKLIIMYQNGDGVSRDYLQEIEWRKKLIELRKQIYQQANDEENGHKLFWEIANLGDAYIKIGKNDLAQEVYEESLSLIEEHTEIFNSQNSKRNLFIIYCFLGDVIELKGDISKAKEYYLTGLKIKLSMTEELNSFRDKEDLANIYRRLANNCYSKHDISKAKEYLQYALDIDTEQAKNSVHIKILRDLSGDYILYADLLEEEKNYQLAKEYFLLALKLREELFKQLNTISSKMDLSLIYNRLGNNAEKIKDYASAKVYYQNSLDLNLSILEQDDTIQAQRNVSISYNNFGNLYMVEHDLNTAKEYYLKALEIRKHIASKTDTISVQKDLAYNYDKLTDIAKEEGNFEEAEEYYVLVLQIRYYLAETLKDSTAFNDLAKAFYKVGLFYPDDIDYESLEKAHQLWTLLYEQFPNICEFKKSIEQVEEYLKNKDK